MIDTVHTDLGDHSVHIFSIHTFSWSFNLPLNSCTMIGLISVLYSINRHRDWSNLMLPQTVLHWLYLYIVHLASEWVCLGKELLHQRVCVYLF